MKSKIMPTVILGIICLVSALILSAINLVTAPEIARRQHEENLNAMREVLPEATNPMLTEVYKSQIDSSITAVYEDAAGYIFQVETTGKNPGMIVMIGIDNEGKIAGTKCTANGETPTYAKPVFDVTENGFYKGMSSSNFKEHLVAGSTMTSKAYSGAVKAALDAYSIIKGGQS